MQHDVDWPAIRADYEAGGLSLRQLAAKHAVSKTYLIERRNKEGWNQPAPDTRPPIDNTGGTTRDINAAVRVQTALKYLIEDGLTWDEIAARAGYASRGAAHNAVKRELDRCITHDIAQLRDQELYMLNRLQARCYKAGMDEKNKDWTWAVDRFVGLSKRKSELMGLDQSADSALVANQIVIREVPFQYLTGDKSVSVTEAKG